MRTTRDRYAAAFLGLGAILILGCGDSIGPGVPTTGSIEITVSTASAPTDIDPDGYALRIDDELRQAIDVNGAVTIGALPRGRYLVRLDGLATNCSVSSTNPLWVNVISTRVSRVSFSVSCIAMTDTGPGGWDY
jgi:hypothetical protein